MIREAEKSEGHNRTLLIGDFNMDPFDKGMFHANGLHAVMDKSIALTKKRVFKREDFFFFYNPMWSRIGDESHGPPGTYFLNRSGRIQNRFWSMFDQVLIRPELLPYYESKNLHVIESINNRSILRNGKPDTTISDHLPLIITMTTENGTV